MSMACVERLGLEVERAWRVADYNGAMFPELAVRLLAAAELTERLTVDDLVRWALDGEQLPEQVNPEVKFGQPPVTLFRGRRFYVEALFWLDGTTSIHQHGFSGAFQVLAGSSIETLFRFEPTRRVSTQFALGDLQTISTCLLKRGDVRPIVSGPRLIHSVFHLDRPSVTVVLRTYSDADSGPQFSYAPPGIAEDPYFEDHARDRALQIASLLSKTNHPDFQRLVGDLVARSDLHTAFHLLRNLIHLPVRSQFEGLIDRVREGAVAERFREAFDEARRIAFLKDRRSQVQESDLRFMLGLLLNVTSRTDALALASARDPGADAAGLLAGWLGRLSRLKIPLQVGGAPWEPNPLGLPEVTSAFEPALARALRGDERPVDAEEAALLGKLRSLPALRGLWL